MDEDESDNEDDEDYEEEMSAEEVEAKPRSLILL